MIFQKMRTILLLLALVQFNAVQLFAQSIIRGPYLQSPTHESIIVMWRTDQNLTSKVWYGTDSSNLNLSAEVNTNATNHTVKLTQLQPGTRYYYQVGSIGSPLSSTISNHSFKTHPIPGTTTPVRVWAIGDFGRANAGQVQVKQSYMDYTGERGTDVWLWLGDNAYNDGTDAQYQEKVFGVTGFSDAFSHVPFWPSPGNHDYNTVWSESTFLGIPYTNIPLSDHEGPYFDMVEVPKYAEAGGYPSQLEVFYSFDYGDVHFLSLNSEVFDYTFSYDGINQMKDWIEADLQQNTRKFTIAYFHQPPYSKGSHDSDDVYELVMKAMREKVIPLLESYDIDLVVNGHSHVFERSHLVKGHYGNSSSFNASTMLMDGSGGNLAQGTPYIKDSTYATAEGTVYIVCGNSGSSEDSPSLNHPVMAYTHGGSTAMGSFVIDVHKNRLDGKYLMSSGVIGDEFTILKKDLKLLPMSNVTICEGSSTVLTVPITGGSDSLHYSWSHGIQIDSAAISVNPTATTTYQVTVTDALTGQVESTSVTVQVTPMQLPIITEVLTGTLGTTGSANDSYQWFINGNPISGANSQYYSPLFSGDYSVVVTNVNGCTANSSVFSYQASVGMNELFENEVVLYPNPADEVISVFVTESLVGEDYVLIDLNGKSIQKGTLEQKNSEINIKELKSGTYLLVVGQNKGRFPFTKK